MNLPRLIRTVRHLKPIQIFYRLYWPLRPIRPGEAPSTQLRRRSGDWQGPIARPPEMTAPGEFCILNQAISTKNPACWNDPARHKLLLYHLHYMQDLSAGNAEARRDWHEELIDQWIDQNPPMSGNGWEPYPLSLRIVNWIKWALNGNPLSERALQSLWIQARVLNQSIEYHLQANHLIANAKGLYAAGAFFNAPEADEWLRKGRRILEAQVGVQVLEDGGHVERSPMYQAVLAEDFLDLVNIGRTFGVAVPRGSTEAVLPMLSWLTLMTHPDGEPAYFNDTVAGNTVSLNGLLDYARRLGIDASTAPNEGLSVMRDSGYARYSNGELCVFVDFGPIGPDFQPGHGHCDCLSFELSLGSQRIIVNTGVSTYNDGPRRFLERSTAAHNTISIEAAEQSEIWGAFRVGRRARPVDVDISRFHVSAAHDGFRHVGIVHRRRFDFLSDGLTISDELESVVATRGTAHFHIHPDVTVERHGDGILAGAMRLSFDNAEDIELHSYEYCLGFNKRCPTTEVRVTFQSNLTTQISLEDPVHIG